MTDPAALGLPQDAMTRLAELQPGRPGSIFTSDLSGQDFWTLLQTGYAPLGMVMGTCVYHVAHRSLGNVLSNIGQNTELPQFTQALYDLAHLGALGAVPGWPGPDRYPAQPMIAQTRAVLDAYAGAGRQYREVALEGSGHGPHLDRPEEFLAALLAHLGGAGPG